MLFKSFVIWLTVFAITSTTICLASHSEEAENGGGEVSVDEMDPAESLNLLRLMGLEHRFKRRRFGKSDPRSLFAAIYSNYPYAKRFSMDDFNYHAEEDVPFSREAIVKRGLKSPLDPRNLFRSVYGFKK